MGQIFLNLTWWRAWILLFIEKWNSVNQERERESSSSSSSSFSSNRAAVALPWTRHTWATCPIYQKERKKETRAIGGLKLSNVWVLLIWILGALIYKEINGFAMLLLPKEMTDSSRLLLVVLKEYEFWFSNESYLMFQMGPRLSLSTQFAYSFLFLTNIIIWTFFCFFLFYDPSTRSIFSSERIKK